MGKRRSISELFKDWLQEKLTKKEPVKPNLDVLSEPSIASESENRFGIIQLSDLQFGEKHRFGRPSAIKDRLLLDIRAISKKHKFTPLYLVFSGDITEQADDGEFDEAKKVIDTLSVSLNIGKTDILCIPGNHDVSRNHSQKFKSYHKFVSEVTDNRYTFEEDIYPRFVSDQLKITEQLQIRLEFLLLNSCEEIEPSSKRGYICPEKLQKTLQAKGNEENLKIAILHHPLHDSINDENLPITNHREIIRTLASHEYNIVLTGHVHQGYINALLCGGHHQIIFASCGSTGIDKSQREDGTPNQYCIHVIDFEKNIFQSIWRAYSPSSNFGAGGWVLDNSSEEKGYSICSLLSKKHTGSINVPGGQNGNA